MKKGVKITLLSLGGVLAFSVLGAAGFVGFVFGSYYRIGDCELDVDHKSSLNTVSTNVNYKVSTYNIGFGAYSQNYTFFLDTGYDDNGNPTCGKQSTANSKKEVLFNVNGAVDTIKNEVVDFAFFQEVDTNSTRSYHVNQNDIILNSFNDYDNIHAKNFHTEFLPYPINDMHGVVEAGITTLSKYKINEAERKEYTVSTTFSKYFDLDRCFSVSKVAVDNGKNLVLINSHMSAYDKGGTIREKQIQELNSVLTQCKEAGDYVIVGGDFNHDLLTYNPEFSYTHEVTPFANTKKTPDWVSFFFDEKGEDPIIDGYTVVASDNTPSCRNNDIEWNPGDTYTCVVDGFIVSDNIDVVSHKNIETKNGNKGLNGFAFSDHEPSIIEFRLQ